MMIRFPKQNTLIQEFESLLLNNEITQAVIEAKWNANLPLRDLLSKNGCSENSVFYGVAKIFRLSLARGFLLIVNALWMLNPMLRHWYSSNKINRQFLFEDFLKLIYLNCEEIATHILNENALLRNWLRGEYVSSKCTSDQALLSNCIVVLQSPCSFFISKIWQDNPRLKNIINTLTINETIELEMPENFFKKVLLSKNKNFIIEFINEIYDQNLLAMILVLGENLEESQEPEILAIRENYFLLKKRLDFLSKQQEKSLFSDPEIDDELPGQAYESTPSGIIQAFIQDDAEEDSKYEEKKTEKNDPMLPLDAFPEEDKVVPIFGLATGLTIFQPVVAIVALPVFTLDINNDTDMLTMTSLFEEKNEEKNPAEEIVWSLNLSP